MLNLYRFEFMRKVCSVQIVANGWRKLSEHSTKLGGKNSFSSDEHICWEPQRAKMFAHWNFLATSRNQTIAEKDQVYNPICKRVFLLNIIFSWCFRRKFDLIYCKWNSSSLIENQTRMYWLANNISDDGLNSWGFSCVINVSYDVREEKVS